MPFRRCFLAHNVLLSLALPVPVLLAQTPGPVPSVAVSKARALYYTPVDSGLESFHCEINFDWKTFIQKASNQPVADDDARLNYFRTVQLSVDDKLRGGGEVHWVAPTPPPDGTEDSVTKVRDGFQQMWSGFFQSWNGFVTGDMVTLDTKSVVDRNATGYHVSAQVGPGLAEEQYDDKLLLQSVHVTTPSLDSTVKPGFTPTPQGLLVSSIRSIYRQPPRPDVTEVLMKLNYAPVSGFQIPSELIVTVGPANFDFHLANCTVQTKLTSR